MSPNSASWALSLKRRGHGRKLGNQDPGDVVGSLNCMEWSLLPPATEEMVVQTSVVKGRFMGDPSHEYEHTELQKMSEGEKVFEEEVVVSEDESGKTERAWAIQSPAQWKLWCQQHKPTQRPCNTDGCSIWS